MNKHYQITIPKILSNYFFRSILVLLMCLGCALTSIAQNSLNTTLLGHLPYEDNLNDIWGYSKNGIDYGIVGTTEGTSIVDLTDPSNPTELFFFTGATSTWRDPKVWEDYAYVVNETSGGMAIIYLGDLPNSIDTLNWTGEGQFYNNDTINHQEAHNIFIDENGIGYLCGGDAEDVLMIDCEANPTNPPVIGRYTGGYVHDLFVRNDTMWTAQIYDGHFFVVDISDKTNPIILAIQSTPFNFTHNLWLSDDGNTIYTTDEKSNAFVAAYDVSDITDIKEIDRYRAGPGTGLIPHNVFVKGDFLITSYYKNGTMIMDATYPYNLIEVGYLDTSPFPAENGFKGCWGVYPYFESGKIIASDMQEGLFVFDAALTPAAYLEGTVTNADTGLPLPNVTIMIDTLSVSVTNTGFNGTYATGTAYEGTTPVFVNSYGYEPQIIDVNFVNGEMAIVDVALVPLPSFNLNIVVTNIFTGEPVLDAPIKLSHSLANFDLTSGSTGAANIELFYTDDYEVFVGKWGFKTELVQQLVDGNTGTFYINLIPEYYDDFALDFGWEVTGNATHGQWERVVPTGVDFAGNITNPYTDVFTDLGEHCFVTGNSGSISDNVNEGVTNLYSPSFDVSTYADPYLSYYRFCQFSFGSDDTLFIKLDNGVETVVIEEVFEQEPSNFESVWYQNQIRISDYLTPTANMQFSATISDLPGTGHVVDAAIDAFRVFDEVAAPSANFMADVTSGCVPLTVNFTNLSTNNPTTLNWAFEGGDINTSNTFSPQVTFELPGTYSISLLVSNSLGEDEIIQSEMITVYENPVAEIIIPNTIICEGDCIDLTAGLMADGVSYTWIGDVDTFEGAELNVCPTNDLENSYTLVATNDAGCSSSTSITLPIETPPTFEVDFPLTVCENSTFSMTATPTDGSTQTYYWEAGEWNEEGATVETNAAGVYLLVATNEAGCNAAINLEVLATAPISASLTPPDNLCLGESYNIAFTLNADENNAPFTYDWAGENILEINDTGINFLVTTANETLDYTVTVTDVFGCTTSATTSVIANNCVFVEETHLDSKIHIYPNPNKGVFTLNLEMDVVATAHLEIQVFNTKGQLIHQQKGITGNSQNITLPSNIDSGIYYVQLVAGAQVFVKKVSVY